MYNPGVLISLLVLLLAVIGGLIAVIFYKRHSQQSLKHSTHIITRPLQGRCGWYKLFMLGSHYCLILKLPQKPVIYPHFCAGQEDLLTTQMFSDQPHPFLPPPYTSTPTEPPASAPSPPAPPPVPSRQPPRYEVIWT